MALIPPELLQAYWKKAARPQLDALLRAASVEPPGPRYLLRLDALLAALRNVAAPSRHVGACHADGAWREAGATVAEACAKYEAFIFQTADGELMSKLELTEQRLAAQLRQEAQRGEQPPARPAAFHSAAVLSRQLRLCRLLRRSFLRGGAGLLGYGNGSEEGLGHLYAVRTAPSGAQDRLTRLLAAEREAVAAVATAVALGPGRLAVPLPVLSAALSTGNHNTGSSSASAASSDNTTSNNSNSGNSRVLSTDTATASSHNSANAAASNPELSEQMELDPLLGPMLAAARAAGVPVEATGLPLTPANLRNLLRRHPTPAVRRAAYEHGLVPRVEAAVGALGHVAAVRGQLAALMGFRSFADYSYSRAGLAVAGADAVTDLLQELADALLPVAHGEMEQLQRALGATAGAAGAQAAPTRSTADNQAGSAFSISGEHEPSSGGAKGTGLALPALEPWDVEYAQGELERQRPSPLPDAAQLAPYLQLRGVLAGLSDLLHDLMGVQLRLEAAEERAEGREAKDTDEGKTGEAAGAVERARSDSRASGSASRDGGPCSEVWGPQVLRLSVWATGRRGGTGQWSPASPPDSEPTEQGPHSAAAVSSVRGANLDAGCRGTAGSLQMRGVVYLDLGTGYGTRQLRFPAGGLEGGGDAGGAAAAAGSMQGQQEAPGCGEGALPAVAVGLKWEWRDGAAESPAALHELLHEMGHALHLTLSSSSTARKPVECSDALAAPTAADAAVMHFGGLQLPLDALEVPSSLLQTLAYDPAAVARICRRRVGGGGAVPFVAGQNENGTPAAGLVQASEPAEAGAGPGAAPGEPLGDPMPPHLAEAVAAHLAAENCSGFGTLGKVLASLFDQLLHSGVLEERGGGRGGAAAAGVAVGLWRAVRRAYGALPACDATLRELAALPALAHHQATFHSYLIGLLVASTACSALPVHARDYGSSGAWDSAWDTLRSEVFEAGADRDAGELIEQWLSFGALNSGERRDSGDLGATRGRGGVERGELLELLARVGGKLVATESLYHPGHDRAASWDS
ncbi:hypothetical protein HXX76_006576 [Chlamydomonas incerta]|uniref:Peptidase M3A/M3B catalytic domain-containing protein n=1 Tax=Chlamydomonas incerta TaxID=51695 RepID=A0A835TE87_CHLIN|nr:hypothetical protein HXX76_006576 [Chlamydomonas incerta]|eukprot:KAG2436265.1 hypothetical protein HXX76_006576 [Chlamydomonas incerta]